MFDEAQELISSIAPQLRRGEILPALHAITPWLNEFRAPGMRLLLELCPKEDRARLVALLRDFVDEYPQRLLALPALIRAQPDRELGKGGSGSCLVFNDCFTLPREVPEDAAPCNQGNLTFIGWLDASVTSSIPRHELLETPELAIHWGRTTPVVGLFEWNDTAWGEPMPTIDGMWLARLLCSPAVRLFLATFEVSDYPTATEIARAMLAGSYPHPPSMADAPDEYFFLDEDTRHRANVEGTRFRALCNGEHFEQPDRRVA